MRGAQGSHLSKNVLRKKPNLSIAILNNTNQYIR